MIGRLPECHNLTIRAVEIEGEPWFVAKDVIRALGLSSSGSNYTMLKAEEVKPLSRGLISGKGMTNAKIISESGLYKLVMRSDKPDAKAFQDWVTREVLPAIRKTGGYIKGDGRDS
jgi:prophage antirepressor-like protein